MSAIGRALEGGCLCGKVRYRLEPGPVDSAYCHCRLRQRASGAPVVAWLSLPAARVRYTQGAPRAYRSSVKALREFCGECGTPLIFRPDHGRTADVSTATLDDPIAAPPAYHIWRMSRLAWFETADALPRYDDSGPDVP